jgi:sensor domain CHASE-containing protein/anti-sigma regulatory factor (Ser/Thr protein kinase)
MVAHVLVPPREERSLGARLGSRVLLNTVRMSIRTKVISLLALVFALLILLEIAVQNQILMPSFADLEREDARTSMRRIRYALDSSLEALEVSAADWGNWADLYHYVASPNPEFLASNLTALELKQLKINTLMITDLTGRVVVARTTDLESSLPLDLDLARRAALPEDFPWRRELAQGRRVNGLLRTNRGIMMLAAAPVLDGSGGGQVRGMVLMGRLLTAHENELLGARAQARLSVVDAAGASAGDTLSETALFTRVAQTLPDIYGNPLVVLRVDVPRTISAHGLRVVSYASAYLAAAAVAVLVVLLLILNRVVLAPLERVTRHAVTVAGDTESKARLDLPGDDEVARLAREFDRMVERLAHARRELIDQSFRAGFAELAKGVLHNLGNAMTPSVVRLSRLEARLRGTPIEDMTRAAEELERTSPEQARFADLRVFLHLGCRELEQSLKQSCADLAVIERQALLVQGSLADLMRSTRNDAVIESVRLPELVNQTLEIVPDASRQLLRVDADESLGRVGAVRVARTVLRMILQNLIINAADAVRAAGREAGTLRLAAEVVREHDKAHLHLECADNGIGIPKRNLERVFEQGFSTKPRETNQGIGLHWCANAIAALGGRIWAVSEGEGRGTAMHVMVPLTLPEVNS